jgi:hypothetical protein
MLRKYLILTLLANLFLSAYSQVNDAGMWLSFNIDKKINKKFSFSLSQELRFNENVTELGTFFTEAGVNYRINKLIRISGNYRFANKRLIDNTYSQRHRFFADINLRKRFNDFQFSYRARFQNQFKDFYSRSNEEMFEYYLRNKISLSYRLNRVFSTYLSFENYTPLNGENYFTDNIRYTLGTEYVFNKSNSIELFYIIQKEYNVNNPYTDFIIGLAYNYSF